MITEIIPCVVSLLETNNIIGIRALLDTGFIDVDTLQAAIKARYISPYMQIELRFLVALVDLISNDLETVNILINKFIYRDFIDAEWDDVTFESFAKLVELGGTLKPERAIRLPYSGFVHYVENNDFRIYAEVASMITSGFATTKVIEYVIPILEEDIKFFTLPYLMFFARCTVDMSICHEIAMREVYARSTLDITMANVIKHYYSGRPIFFDRYIGDCECQEELTELMDRITAYHNGSFVSREAISEIIDMPCETDEEFCALIRRVRDIDG